MLRRNRQTSASLPTQAHTISHAAGGSVATVTSRAIPPAPEACEPSRRAGGVAR
jgi:hypothetical protein